MNRSKKPQGYYMSIGIALGIPMGIPIGVALDNIALGPVLGVVLGAAIGTALEAKYKDNIRPQTSDEQKMKKIFLFALFILFVLGIATFSAMIFLSSAAK